MNLRLERTPSSLLHCGIFWIGVALAALILLTGACAPLADPGDRRTAAVTLDGLEDDGMKELSAIRIPGGLADPDGEFAYVVGPGRQIYRLDLESGATQARTNFPGTPLAIVDQALIGWSRASDLPDGVRLFSLLWQGDVLSLEWQQKIELPAWVEVDSPEPGRFTLQAQLRDEQLVVTWQARSRYGGGAPPPPGIEAAETRDASAVLYLDPETGKILKEERQAPAPAGEPRLPDLPPNRRIVPYLQDGSWFTQPWSVNAGEAFLVATAGEPGIVLVRREPGSPAGSVEVRLTGDPGAQAAVTPGGKLVFIHEPASASPSWVVYSLESGEVVARLPFDPGTEGVSVVADRVLYLVVQERGGTRHTSLRSRDLRTGQGMWSFRLREETTGMPPPPPPRP